MTFLPRPARRLVGLGAAITLAVVGNPQAAFAQFLGTISAGPEPLVGAMLSAPAALASSTPVCSSTNAEDTDVPLSWTGSNTVDADGKYVVGYYRVLRSVGASAYSAVGSTSGAPPATSYADDTAGPSSPLPPTTYYAISGNTLEAKYGAASPWSTLGAYSFGPEPDLLAATPDGTRVYAAESAGANNGVLVVDSVPGDANYDHVVSTVTLAGSGAVPIAVAMAPDGADLYVLDGANNAVDVVPVPTPVPSYTVTRTIPVGDVGDPAAMAMVPGSSQLLVANYYSGTITVISTASDTVTSTVALPAPTSKSPQPTGIVVTPSGADAYVVDGHNNLADEVALTGPSAGTVVASLAVGNQGPAGSPAAIDAVNNPSSGTEVYVGDGGTTTVSVISAATNSVTNVPVGGAGQKTGALVAAPDGCFVAVVSNGGSGSAVSLLNASTNAVMSTTTQATGATCIAVPGASNAYQDAAGAVVAVPTQVSYELQASQTPAGGGFGSALSSPITVSLGRGQVP